MRFLLDQCLSKLANLLSTAGHDVAHVRERGLSFAEDDAVLACAEAEGRVLVTTDSDFPAILTLGNKRTPSCILFRGEFKPVAAEQARLLLSALPNIAPQLQRGALVVIAGSKVRVRDLPVTGD